MITSPAPESPPPPAAASAERSAEGSSVLTDRGRLTVSIIVAVGGVLLMSLVAWVLSALLSVAEAPAHSTVIPAVGPSGDAVSAASPTPGSDAVGYDPASTAPSGTATTRATPVAPNASASPTAERTIVRSGLAPTDEWVTSRLAVPPAKKTSRVNTYHFSMETAVDLDVDDVARQIASILNDERGWTGYDNHSFQLVGKDDTADFTIRLASPRTVDRLCLPLNTRSLWSCRIGDTVALNSDRWLYMTPTHMDIDDYRAYLVNHEVGHYIGLAHVGCPAEGAKAPVMMQQSKSLAGCLPNPWPAEEG